MKKVMVKRKHGIWYYERIEPNSYNELDGRIYELYNERHEYVTAFGLYYDMISAIEYGNVDEWIRIYG